MGVKDSFTWSTVDTEVQTGVTGIIVAAWESDPEKSVTAAIDNFSSKPAPELPEAPELAIQQAVQLSWPLGEGNFQLETTRELIGAWRKMDIPVIEVDGMLQATVLKEATNRYFRLRPIAE